MLGVLEVWDFISDARVAGTWHNVFGIIDLICTLESTGRFALALP